MKYSPNLLYAAFIFAPAGLFAEVAKAQANSPGKWVSLGFWGHTVNGPTFSATRSPLRPRLRFG
jgi:hypothetical protein